MKLSHQVFSVAALLLVALTHIHGQTIYDADFSNEGDGFADHTTSSPPASAPASVDGGSATSPEGRWTASYTSTPGTDTTDNEFSVNSGVLRMQDWGGESRWESFSIDVSAVSQVTITATGVTIGDDVQNGSSEFFEYFYTLDSGSDVVTSVPLSGDTAGTAVDYSVINLDVSTANTLTVGFNFDVNGAGDGYEIDSFTVTSGADTTPPALVSTSPSDGDTNVVLNPVVELQFDETVVAGTGNINIRETSTDNLIEAFNVTSAVTFNGDTVSFTPTSYLASSTSYYVEIESGAITDGASNATTELSASGDLDFTTGTEVTESMDAIGSVSIESGGPNETSQFYAQNSGGGFDEYSLAEFSVSPVDFNGFSINAISQVLLNLTVNDRTFSASGDYFILFTTDGKADLTSSTDYDDLTFNAASTYGIDGTQFTVAPVTVTTAQTFDGSASGGTVDTVTIDLTSISTDLINAINAGDSFHFLIGSPDIGGATATYSGFGNTFDPGAPQLEITATPDAAVDALVLTESGGSTDVEEGGATDTIDVALNSIPGSNVDVILTPDGELDLGNGAGNAVTLTFTPANATTDQQVTVTAFDDSATENLHTGDITVTTSTSDAGYTGLTDTITVNITDNDTVTNVIITQYYEGSSNNKYIELTNVSGSPVSLSGWVFARWGNADAEDYKTAGNTPADTLDLTPLGTLAAGQTVIIANSSAASPVAAADADLTDGFPGPVTFNGNDSVAIYPSANYDPSNIVDLIGFTDAGNEGQDTSFVRASTAAGYDLTAGSNATSFPSVWTEVTTSTVDGASSGDDEFLGTTALATAPTSVSFTTGAQTVAEDDGSFDLEVEIANLSSGSVSVSITFSAANSTADSGDIIFTSPQQLTFDSASLVTPQTITVPIIDDGVDGSTEIASFDLSVSSGTAIVASPGTQDVSIQDSDVSIPDLIISEVADPSDDFDGRYVEIYNPTGSTVDLGAGNWTLARYANANTSAADISLTGTIAAGGTYVVANDDAEYVALYGVGSADQESGSISGNGDDTYALYFSGSSTTGTLVDIYGEIGTDGSGEPWEYEDSRAYRNTSVTTSNSTWTAAEWTIESAAVADMTPGSHPEVDLPDLSISVTPTAVDEGEGAAAATFTVSVPTAINDVNGLDVTIATTGDTSDLSGIPTIVTIPDQATQTTFSVDATILDGVVDGNQAIDFAASATGYDPDTVILTVNDVDTVSSPGNVFISQYYHSIGTGDSGFDESWIEIHVPTGETVDFTGYTLSIFADIPNTNQEGWKTGGTSDFDLDLSSLGNNVTGPATFIISDDTVSINNPSYAVGNKDIADDNFFFEGADSIVLYSGTPSLPNLVDAISVTATQGASNTSIVRVATGTGFDLTSGSTYLDFPGIWETRTLTTVNTAAASTNDRLGFADFASGGGGFASFIAAQSGSGGTGENDDKNGNGIDNKTEYAFQLDADAETTTSVGSGRPFRDLFSSSVDDTNIPATPADRTDDTLAYLVELPASVPSDVTIEVIASDSPDGTGSPTTLATYSGGSWSTGSGVVVEDSPSSGIDTVRDSQTVSAASKRFISLEITIN